MEEHFKTVSELSEAEKIFSEAAGKQEAGMQLVIENGQVAAMALCYGEKRFTAFPQQALSQVNIWQERMEELCTAVPSVSVVDPKPQLPYLKNRDRRVVDGSGNDGGSEAMFDAGVAGYLLNPLKDTYDYDDLARGLPRYDGSV